MVITPELEAALEWAESFEKYGGKPCQAEVIAAALRTLMAEIKTLTAERNHEIKRTDILDDMIEAKDDEIAAKDDEIAALKAKIKKEML